MMCYVLFSQKNTIIKIVKGFILTERKKILGNSNREKNS